MRTKSYMVACAVLLVAFGGHNGLTSPSPLNGGGCVLLSDLMQASMKSGEGEDVGKLEDFLFDPASGEIEYAVVVPCGFLGIGEKRVPVPWTSIHFESPAELQVFVDREELKAAPSTDKEYSTVQNRAYVASIRRFFSERPAYGGAESP